MLKRILLSGAALTAFASFAVAQTPPATEPAAPPAGTSAPAAPAAQAEPKDPNLFTSMKGASVVGDNDESVGSIADALVTPAGDLRAVVLAHGGLVGIGQTYRQYDVSELPALADDQVKIQGLSTASIESVPEFTYPEAEGRAATSGSAPATGTNAAPAEAPAMPLEDSALIPVSNLIGATVEGSANDAAIEDLKFEGNKAAAVILNDDANTEVPFTELAFAGSAADPKISMKAGGGAAAPAPDAASPAPDATAPAAPAPAAPAPAAP